MRNSEFSTDGLMCAGAANALTVHPNEQPLLYVKHTVVFVVMRPPPPFPPPPRPHSLVSSSGQRVGQMKTFKRFLSLSSLVPFAS